jgi:hypothetical protein
LSDRIAQLKRSVDKPEGKLEFEDKFAEVSFVIDAFALNLPRRVNAENLSTTNSTRPATFNLPNLRHFA